MSDFWEHFFVLPLPRPNSDRIRARINHGGGVSTWGDTHMSVLTKIEGVAALESNLPVGLVTGTNVRTPIGPSRVENLRVGDLIVTRRDGLQPLRMIWKRTIAA